MKHRGLYPALALGLLLAAPGAWAQGRGGGGFGMSTVTKVDATAGTLELSGRQGQTRTVTVPASATILRQVDAAATDLKVGDTLAVTGQPRQIDARSVQMGETFTLGPARAGGRQGAGGDRAGAVARGGRFGGRALGVRVQGTVAATTPNLQLKLANGETVQVNHSADTRFQRTVRATLADIKTGERVRVFMEPGGSTVRAIMIGGAPAGRAADARPQRRNRAAQAPATPAR